MSLGSSAMSTTHLGKYRASKRLVQTKKIEQTRQQWLQGPNRCEPLFNKGGFPFLHISKSDTSQLCLHVLTNGFAYSRSVPEAPVTVICRQRTERLGL